MSSLETADDDSSFHTARQVRSGVSVVTSATRYMDPLMEPLLPGQDDEEQQNEMFSDGSNHYTRDMDPRRLDVQDDDASSLTLSTASSISCPWLLLSWQDGPSLLASAVAAFACVPSLLLYSAFMWMLTGRLWPATLFAAHLLFITFICAVRMSPKSLPSVMRLRILPCVNCKYVRLQDIFFGAASICDIILFGVVYRLVANVIINDFFTDADDTPVIEWERLAAVLRTARFAGVFGFTGRVVLGILCILSRISPPMLRGEHVTDSTEYDCWRYPFVVISRSIRDSLQRTQNGINFGEAEVDSIMPVPSSRIILRKRIHGVFVWGSLASVVFLAICIMSCISHLTQWHVIFSTTPPMRNSSHAPFCDPLDATDCALPFPSFFHMARDNTTETGWRVNLRGETLPIMRGGGSLQPDFLNDQLDGFSTLAPILFYIPGIKLAHVVHRNQTDPPFAMLQGGLDNFENSMTSKSITLLIDVTSGKLVPHSAEIDFMNPDRPLVMVVPASPLRHATHYAVVVSGATTDVGSYLPPTKGMAALWKAIHDPNSNDTSPDFSDRVSRYRDVLLPTLQKAAPWTMTRASNPPQLIFDFVTASAKVQLGTVRAVRDAALSHAAQQNWTQHVNVVKIEDYSCKRDSSSLLARTVYGSLDVPWFLGARGIGQRGAALPVGSPPHVRGTGTAKFTLNIPCSLRDATLHPSVNSTKLRAVVEYGHGLLYHRDESESRSLMQMANESGYIIVAMDWRGMSAFDVPLLLKAFLSNPNLLQGIRDNVIQGYANKLCLQHFIRNGLLSQEWLKFSEATSNHLLPIPTQEGAQPASIFYGNSLGGILGSGYTALLGPTGLIDKAILGAPSISFSVVLIRSKLFLQTQWILERTLYDSRHVRLFLSIFQMAFDSIEASGMLAQPKSETLPKTLLQSGLGDVTIPTVATETLARAYGASILPNNPRQSIFGLTTANEERALDGSLNVMLTELNYTHEFASISADDVPQPNNDVHFCMRQDCGFMAQIERFVNTKNGQMIDICADDDCLRTSIPCYYPWKRDSIKPNCFLPKSME